ncbi:TPA: peptidoglycan-binding protein [Clostridium botulinum]|uniref:GH25 family lysozyme n=1 Tax=Clostridium TaxID=1485 RepID=UPI000773EF2F|nr:MULTISPECIES: GH25 family lysozyme [Clostridium]AUM94645.1 glycosyl hydrolase [Clostridium sporogenes]AVQ52079.1 glycosyl hydrolase [Clostridium botulinum]HBJ2612249.1 peptidoglycan-binding protein [Clostridium botulinum]
MKGIDISMHNGNVNFYSVKNSGINVVIIKATEGVDYVDPLLDQYYNGAKSAGLNIGFYHFMSEKSNPTQQAVDFWNSIKNKQFNILPCLDIETNTMGRGRTEISNRCIQFLNKFKSLSGYDCMIYTGGYFGRDNLDSRVKEYPGWIAHYGVNQPMETGFKVVGHQYTETGHINGVSGNVDLDNFTDKIFIGKVDVQPSKLPGESSSTIYGRHSLIGALQKEINNQGLGNIAVDNTAGEATLSSAPICRQGARGNITKIIQEMLINIGYPVGSYGADGILGSSTVTAIKSFQKDCNLNPDGIVGKETWKSLFRSLK